MVSVVNEGGQTSFDQSHNVFSPVDTAFGQISDTALSKSALKAVILKTLINPFSTNDL